jgi:hypothetical protein
MYTVPLNVTFKNKKTGTMFIVTTTEHGHVSEELLLVLDTFS